MKTTAALIPALLALLSVTESQAATITLANGNFQANQWNSYTNFYSASNPAPDGWRSSITDGGPGNYGEPLSPLPGIIAFLQDRGGNYYQQGLTASDQGAVDATTFSSYTVRFDYGYRRESATSGDINLLVQLWNTTDNALLATDTVTMQDPGVGLNSLTPGNVVLAYDNTLGSLTGNAIAIRFVHAGNGSKGFNATAMLDNVSITAVPEPSSAVLLGLAGVPILLRRLRVRALPSGS